jgi:hypothetical protein
VALLVSCCDEHCVQLRRDVLPVRLRENAYTQTQRRTDREIQHKSARVCLRAVCAVSELAGEGVTNSLI